MEYYCNTNLEEYDIWREKEMSDSFEEELREEDEQELNNIETLLIDNTEYERTKDVS